MEGAPLPRSLLRSLFASVILLAVIVVSLQFALPTLRQGRLLEVCLPLRLLVFELVYLVL